MTSSKDAPEKITYHYIKSNYFRVVHADGAWGGWTAAAKLHIDFYSERAPIPKQMTLELTKTTGDQDGLSTRTVGDEIKDERVSLDGIVREIEVGVTMDLQAAKGLLEWLQKRIQIAEESNQDSDKEEA